MCGTYHETLTVRWMEVLVVSTTTRGMVKRSYCFEPDEMTWLKAEAIRQDRPINWLLRQLVRAAMDAEREQNGGAAA